MSITTVIVPPGGGLDTLRISSSAPREPGPGEITVRLHACSLNYHDYVVVSGAWPPREPRIPLSDGAGVVTAVGAGVADLAVGDQVVSLFFPEWVAGPPGPREANFARVPGDGIDGYARTAVTTAATAFTRAPRGYSHAEAATLPCAALTAWRALVVDGGVKPGDAVLVQGTGGVSLFALQFAKRAGATVIATSSSAEKLEKLTALGADHVLNYRSTPAWGEAVRELTGGRGVDHVIEVGGPETLEQSMLAARVGGHVALIGILTGTAGRLPVMTALAKHLRLQGLIVGSRRDQLDMITALEAGGPKPIIDGCYPLEDIGEAFRRLESQRHFGKICLEM
jgi:NADPH:quinone reductase-like Zn-dependent oxidoreductase